MNIARGSGRNVEPVNFSKEIFLRVNLPPLYILKRTMIPEIVKQKTEIENKEYFRRLDLCGPNRKSKKLKFSTVSVSIGNFRVKELEKSRLPIITE